MSATDMDILQSGLDGAMAEQELNGVGIDASVKQVRGERMAQRLNTLLINRRSPASVTHIILFMDKQSKLSGGYAGRSRIV